MFTYIRSAKAERERYTVQVGDVLSIKVDGLQELSVEEFAVLPDGTIYAPQVGSLKVAGASVDEIVTALKQNYVNLRLRDPKVTVSINEVNDPASEFLESLSVGELGPTVSIEVPFSDTVTLPFHGDFNPRVPVSEWRTALESATYQKFGGALEVIVNVDRASDNNVFVIGEVADPSEISIAVADNAFSAIAAAGGFLKTAARKRLIVIRTDANGKRRILPLNLKDLMQGKSQQSALILRPGDILVVPPTRIAQSNTAVEQYVRNLLPFDLNLGFGIDFQND